MDDDLLALFRSEAEGLVESLEAGLLSLQERPGDRELIDQVFRDLHTLKGTGGMFGRTDLAGFVHGFETAFENLRSGGRRASPALIAVSLRAHDHILALLAGPGGTGSDEILAELARVASGQDVEDATGEAPPSGGSGFSQDVVSREPPAARASAVMRVSADRLNEMMDRVGELVIAEARLAEIAARSGMPALVSVTEDIQRLATGMRDAAMSIRMTPLATITGRFRRLIHDLASTLGKAIDLTIEGEDTELDKTLVEGLAEPLMHLIRNSADHGIEDAATRLRLGKPPTGCITLAARHSGTEVLIELSDDGRGLDRDRIRQRAIDKGLLSLEVEPDPGALFSLIFEPGFSTAPTVTEVSGRGVGMDVVRRMVADLRGTIDLSSQPGEGTTVTLRLPLTLAIIDGLLVDVAGERFVVPLAAVEEIVEHPSSLATGRTKSSFLDIRGRLVPCVVLREAFGSEGAPAPFQKVVSVNANGSRVGLVVDRIIGSNQTVIKQLSPFHAGLRTFSGATILGDGSVALILDVPGLVTRARRTLQAEPRLAEVAA